MHRYVCVIPAKQESKRAPGKNELLWEYTLRAALEVATPSQVIVSTDSTRIFDTAMRAGVRTHWRGEDSPLNKEGAEKVTLAVLRHNEEPNSDHVIQLLPTAPLRGGHHIAEAIRMFEERDPEGCALISVTPLHGRAICYEASNGWLYHDKPRIGVVDNQWDQPLNMFLSNGAIQITKVGLLRQHGSFWDIPKRIPFLMDHRSGFDVDSIAQLGMARRLLEEEERE